MSREEYIAKLKEAEPYIREKYEVKSMCMFGSTARGTNTEGSDIDLYVDMPPKMTYLVRLGNYLEELLGKSVDLVLPSKCPNVFLLKEIKRDGITIF